MKKKKVVHREVRLTVIRKAIANYMSSEGCSCCEDTDEHKKHEKYIAKLLSVPMYKDKSGYDFPKFGGAWK